MSALTHPNHPARLIALFAAAVAGAGIVAAAILAGGYVWRDITASSEPAATPGAVDTPDGLIVLTPVDDAAMFEERTGFAPFVPERLPRGTDATPKFAVTQPDADGRRIGRIGYSAQRGFDIDGIGGPVVVIAQAQGDPGEGIDGELKQIGSERALAAALACGDLVLDVQLYFSADAPPGPEAITPYMHRVASEFVDDVQAQCTAGR
jgi:hypothetical protein